MSADSGAAPETKNRILPPVRARSLAKTSRSATFFLTLRPPGIGSPASDSVAHCSPARFAQKKIVRLMALPDSAFWTAEHFRQLDMHYPLGVYTAGSNRISVTATCSGCVTAYTT